MGFAGVAEATTFAGEFTVAPSPGLEMVSGKAEDGGDGGSCAGGAGKELVCGDHVGGIGVGVGLGAGAGEGAGVGCGAGGAGEGPGAGASMALDAPPPHPAANRLPTRREPKNKAKRVDEDNNEDNTFTAGAPFPGKNGRIKPLRLALHSSLSVRLRRNYGFLSVIRGV